MTLHTAMHLLGCGCLLAIAIVAAIVFADAWRQRERIWALVRTNFEPLGHAASTVFPRHAAASDQEASAE